MGSQKVMYRTQRKCLVCDWEVSVCPRQHDPLRPSPSASQRAPVSSLPMPTPSYERHLHEHMSSQTPAHPGYHFLLRPFHAYMSLAKQTTSSTSSERWLRPSSSMPLVVHRDVHCLLPISLVWLRPPAGFALPWCLERMTGVFVAKVDLLRSFLVKILLILRLESELACCQCRVETWAYIVFEVLIKAKNHISRIIRPEADLPFAVVE